ncbi:hypothetical protein Pfo_018945 [Paulownia fortunei]|nr:hypothetical protein Pfo_018945 [Paulownia fortunei]
MIQIFSEFLLIVGNGEEPSDIKGNIKIPEKIIIEYNNEENSTLGHNRIIFSILNRNALLTYYITISSRSKNFNRSYEAINNTNNYNKNDVLNSLTLNGLPSHKKHVFIPRILFSSTEYKGYPFQLRNKQFHIKLCFVITIKKAQKQTISNVDVYVPHSVFFHGQLYIALSK